MIGDFNAVLDDREPTDYTVFSDFDQVSNACCFDDSIRAYMYMVTDLHWVVRKNPFVCFVGRSDDRSFAQ